MPSVTRCIRNFGAPEVNINISAANLIGGPNKRDKGKGEGKALCWLRNEPCGLEHCLLSSISPCFRRTSRGPQVWCSELSHKSFLLSCLTSLSGCVSSSLRLQSMLSNPQAVREVLEFIVTPTFFLFASMLARYHLFNHIITERHLNQRNP